MAEGRKKSQIVKGIPDGNYLTGFIVLLSGSENGWHHLVVLFSSKIQAPSGQHIKRWKIATQIKETDLT